MGVSVPQSASKFMLGHHFTRTITEDLYDSLKPCPEVVPHTRCYENRIFNISSFSAYHVNKRNGRPPLTSILEPFRTIQKIGYLHPDIKYYFDNINLKLCK